MTFPYDIYRCEKHGLYAYHNDKLELVNFSRLGDEVERSELPDDANVRWFDPTIVDMKCPLCGERWKQYRGFPSAAYGGAVFCPNNHSVEKETALQK